MILTLREAMEADLENINFNNRNEQITLLRNIMGKALYQIQLPEGYVGEYFLGKSKHEIEEEIRNQGLYNEKQLLNSSDVLNNLCVYVVDEFRKVDNFSHAVKKTIDYNVRKMKTIDEKTVKKLAKLVLDRYLSGQENWRKTFSSKNGTYSYVEDTPPQKNIDEIYRYCGVEPFSISREDIVDKYSSKIASEYMEKFFDKRISQEQVENNFIEDIISRINNANLNDKQKEYLMDALNSGDYEQLIYYSIMSRHELESYYNQMEGNSITKNSK